jgi:hypothetical protein
VSDWNKVFLLKKLMFYELERSIWWEGTTLDFNGAEKKTERVRKLSLFIVTLSEKQNFSGEG